MRISIIEEIHSSSTKKECIDLVTLLYSVGDIPTRGEYEIYLNYIEWEWER